MELFAVIGFIVVVLIAVVGVNLYRRPDWTKRKLGSLFDKVKK